MERYNLPAAPSRDKNGPT